MSTPRWNAAPDSREGPRQERHCPHPAHAEGEYQQAEGAVKRNSHPGGIWQRDKVGLGWTSPSPGPSASGGRGLTRGPAMGDRHNRLRKSAPWARHWLERRSGRLEVGAV